MSILSDLAKKETTVERAAKKALENNEVLSELLEGMDDR